MKKFLTFLAVMLISMTAINAEDLYLRGGVNGWNASADYKFTDKGDGTFTLDKTFDLEGQFKFADANWGSVLNFGSTEEATCSEQGVTISLVTNGDNISTKGKLSITKIVVDKNQKKATFYGTTGAASDAVYTIAGQSALMGADWDPSATTNDMTDMKDGTYQLVKENISLAVGDYEYKAVKNHTWGIWEYPSSGNNKLTISEAGTYTVTFTLTPATPALTANAVKSGEPQPVETKYYAKNNWNGAASDNWSWKEMAKEEDLYVLDSVVFGGTGININSKEDDTDAKWFALKDMTYVGEDTIRALDTVRFELSISDKDTILTAIKLGRPAPVARKEFVFVAGETAASDPAMFAITWGKDGSNEMVKMTQKGEEALYTANILETVDSVVLVRCASDATEIIWDGEGKNIWNQTANYALCDTMYFESWVEETNLFAIKCDTPEPVETKYYAKNNWNGAAADDWSWLEMSATNKENIYMLDSVVFGGTGVNINDKEDDTDALWFAADAITVLDGLDGLPTPTPPAPQKRDTIPYAPARTVAPLEAPTLLAGDTIKLFFNAADSTLSAAIVGRPAPVARKEFVFVAGEAAASDPALFAITWGKDGSNETVKLANKADDIYTAEILETVDSVVLVRCATDATEIIWDGEGKNIWNQTTNYALCDTMYFESWVEETNLFAVTCEAPQPVEDKFYVTGNDALVGEEKAWQADAIEMVDYTYTFPMLAAGEYQLKVTDGTWEHAWGYDNLSPTVAIEGLYSDVDGNICFTVYTPNDVTVTFAQGYVVVTGDFTNPTPATPDYGLLVNGTDYQAGTPEDKGDYVEYAVNIDLVKDEFVQLYDNVNKAAWTVNPEGEGFTNFDIHDNAYYIKQAGSYQFYIKIPKEGMNSGLYVGYQSSGTALDEILMNTSARKFILNGRMFIRRDNMLYNAQGARMK